MNDSSGGVEARVLDASTPNSNQSGNFSGRVVAKFGGTSVQSAQNIAKVCQIIQKNPIVAFLVVSAVGGVTNKLVSYTNSPPNEREKLILELQDIHFTIAKSLNLDVENKINEILQRLTCYIQQASLTNEAIDDIVSVGEDISAILVSGYLNQIGVKNTLLDARKLIITDDTFCKATPILPEIKARTTELGSVSEGSCYVVQGFVGGTLSGRTTTLGRGGSDYTAALIGEAVGAREVLIYTDVPGVYTMDPNTVPAAKPIPQLSFQEMAEMANFGAKVLHPATIEPCLRAQIPVKILSTFEPEKPGTEVFFAEKSESQTRYRAVTMRKAQHLVTIKSLKMLDTHGFLANIFTILAKYKISIDLITTSEVSVALTVDGTSTGSHGQNPFHNPALLADLRPFADVVLEEGLVLVAIVGSNLISKGTIQNILSILGHETLRMICYGASGSSIGILVQEADAKPIAAALHRALIEKGD